MANLYQHLGDKNRILVIFGRLNFLTYFLIFDLLFVFKFLTKLFTIVEKEVTKMLIMAPVDEQ